MSARVLLITNDYPPGRGGIQRYLVDLVDAYPGEMLVAAPADPTGSPAAGVFPGPAGFMWPTGGTRRWLLGLLHQHRPDVVLFGAPHPLAFLGPSLGLPYAVLAHGAEVSIGRIVPGYGALMARSLRKAGAVMAVSEHTAHAVRRAAHVDCEVVGAGVDLARFRPADIGEDLVVACVSRFVPRKGHARVIEAAENLARRGVAARVVLAGEGRLAGRLRERAATAAVPVEVVESPSDVAVASIYANASVFCMPARSRWFGLEREGLGLVYLEAAASGLPVLAGRSGGAPETVEPGRTGFVVDSTSDLEAALEVLADPEVRRAFGAAGRARVEERHNWSTVAARFQRILDSLA